MNIFTDFQPYLLPNTDIWALSKDKAIELLAYLESKGICQVFCMPPVRKENSQNSVEFLKKQFTELKDAYTGKIVLKLLVRYRLDEAFECTWQNYDTCEVGGAKKMFVEVPPLKEIHDYWQMLEAIIELGYTPIVMQPERTEYWTIEDCTRLKQIGCRFMLNLYSLFGYNGDGALFVSRMLLEKGMYTYLFSGMEDTKVMYYSEQIEMEDDVVIMSTIEKLINNNRLLWSVNTNE